MTHVAEEIHVTATAAAIRTDGAILAIEILTARRTPRAADAETRAIITIIVAAVTVDTITASATPTMTGITTGTTAIGMATRIATGVINPGAGIGAVVGAPVGDLKSDRSVSAFLTDRPGLGDITTTGIRTGLPRRFAA